jgi:ferredoxin
MIDTKKDVYRLLQKHLNRQAVGFPAEKSGVEIRILKCLFTPDEARLALRLTYKPASLESVCVSASADGIPPAEVKTTLDAMHKKGAIGVIQKGDVPHYCVFPFAVGILEQQVRNASLDFTHDVGEYMGGAFAMSLLSVDPPQLRFIPVSKSVSVETCVNRYDNVIELIKSSPGPFALGECGCKKIAAIQGNPCKMTSRLELCLAMGDAGRSSIESGNGREITREEALEHIRQSEAEGLVLETTNTQNIEYLCSCCKCCCGALKVQHILPPKVLGNVANYYTSVNSACIGCGLCVKKCQVDAISVKDKKASVDLSHCLGCGNCVSACKVNALALLKKKKEVTPPKDMETLYAAIMANKSNPRARLKYLGSLIYLGGYFGLRFMRGLFGKKQGQ